MCKGKAPGQVVQTIQAGSTINVAFEGSAKHGGVKHCDDDDDDIIAYLHFRVFVNSPCPMTMIKHSL